jgi:hypothetical protein
MDIQRLRNLTTGLLHTKIGDVYEDLDFITRGGGIMTHMIPRVMKAVEPWLREKITDPRFWDGKFDQEHVGVYPLDCMTAEENREAMARYAAMPDPLAGKQVAVVRM